MSATAERTFIRPDGSEKVTGTGRYTADLTVAGQVHARFRYADHTRARIAVDRHLARACAPGRVGGRDARGRARRALRAARQGQEAIRQG